MKNVSLIPFTTTLEKRFNAQLKKIYVGQSVMKKRRPILNNINVTDNGNVQITNGYVGVQLANTSATPSELEGYPGMTRLFEVDYNQVDHATMIFWEDLKLLEDHLNVIYKHKVDTVKITLSNKGITIENKDRHNMDTFLKSEIVTDILIENDRSFNINPRFLHDCLMFFRQIYKKGYHIVVWTYQDNLIRFTYQDLTYIIATKRSS